MKKLHIGVLLMVIAVLVPATLLSADQIELTQRDTPAGVQVITIDDTTGQIVETINGTPVAERAATGREIAAVARADRTAATENTRATVSAALAKIAGRPSVNPEIARLEQAYIALAAALGIE